MSCAITKPALRRFCVYAAIFTVHLSRAVGKHLDEQQVDRARDGEADKEVVEAPCQTRHPFVSVPNIVPHRPAAKQTAVPVTRAEDGYISAAQVKTTRNPMPGQVLVP